MTDQADMFPHMDRILSDVECIAGWDALKRHVNDPDFPNNQPTKTKRMTDLDRIEQTKSALTERRTELPPPVLTQHDIDGIRAECASLRAERDALLRQFGDVCEDCGALLMLCGPQDNDGEPTLDCQPCKLRAQIASLRAERDALKAELDTLGKEQP